jgi:hypothetical protein
MKKLIAVTALLFCTASNAAVTIGYDNSQQFSTTALTGYTTNGAMMDGMTVQVNGTDTFVWADIDSNSGGVSDGFGFSLRADGDTYGSKAWTLKSNSNITSILLDAGAGDSVFDTYFGGSSGTTGSAAGRNFSGNYKGDIKVTYSGMVGLDGQSAVGDLYRYMLIEFTGSPFTGKLSFTQDTDNLSISGDISAVPVPAAVWLFGSGLVGFLGMSRRKMA